MRYRCRPQRLSRGDPMMGLSTKDFSRLATESRCRGILRKSIGFMLIRGQNHSILLGRALPANAYRSWVEQSQFGNSCRSALLGTSHGMGSILQAPVRRGAGCAVTTVRPRPSVVKGTRNTTSHQDHTVTCQGTASIAVTTPRHYVVVMCNKTEICPVDETHQQRTSHHSQADSRCSQSGTGRHCRLCRQSRWRYGDPQVWRLFEPLARPYRCGLGQG